jgi:hypothetical protein
MALTPQKIVGGPLEVSSRETNVSRSYSVQDVDERAPVLVQVLSHIIALQRMHGVHPVRIVVSADVYTLLATYVGGSVDKLFNVHVVADCDPTAMPFVIISEGMKRDAR